MTEDPLGHLPPGSGPAASDPAPRAEGTAAPRFPYLRARLLEVCAHREEGERLLARASFHPVEKKIYDWGRLSAVQALHAYPDKDASVRRNLTAMERDFWRRELEDTAEVAFSLLAPILEWRLEEEHARVVLRVEDHPQDPSSGEYDFERVRHRRLALPLDDSKGPELRVEILEEELYVVTGIDPSCVEGPGEKPAFDPTCLGDAGTGAGAGEACGEGGAARESGSKGATGGAPKGPERDPRPGG